MGNRPCEADCFAQKDGICTILTAPANANEKYQKCAFRKDPDRAFTDMKLAEKRFRAEFPKIIDNFCRNIEKDYGITLTEQYVMIKSYFEHKLVQK